MSNLPANHPFHGISLRKWAKANSYPERTVQITVQRWAHRTDRVPHGGLARQIMAKLRTDITSAQLEVAHQDTGCAPHENSYEIGT